MEALHVSPSTTVASCLSEGQDPVQPFVPIRRSFSIERSRIIRNCRAKQQRALGVVLTLPETRSAKSWESTVFRPVAAISLPTVVIVHGLIAVTASRSSSLPDVISDRLLPRSYLTPASPSLCRIRDVKPCRHRDSRTLHRERFAEQLVRVVIVVQILPAVDEPEHRGFDDSLKYPGTSIQFDSPPVTVSPNC